MQFLTSGEAVDAQVAAVCTAVRIKGATATELAGFASVLREQCTTPDHTLEDLVDTCGTGGGAPSFNISTSAAFIAAGAGVKIAKHGNRGVTSTCGSADVLETLGAKIQTDWDVLIEVLGATGVGFLFAQSYHPTMKNVNPARRALGFRTFFNQMGPLLNPLGAKRQLVGVYDPALAFAMAEAFMKLGSERVLVAHGDDGLDEISPVGPTRYALLWDGELSEGILTPQGFGLEPVDEDAVLPANNLEGNAALMREAVTNPDSPRCRAVLPSAACAIWISGLTPDRKSAAELAREAVRSGAAAGKLDAFVKGSKR
jgi:anthranilate phosphoribosyltransferase